MGLECLQYTGGPLMCNGYLAPSESGDYVAVDAPAGFAAWVERTLPAGARLTHLLITHQHFDHIADAAALQRATGCSIYAQAAYNPSLTLAENARSWGIPEPEPFHTDRAIAGDALLTIVGRRWQALHIPGHSPDSLVWLPEGAGELFAGDVLFAGSVGRTDFPGGSMAQLVRGIRSKIMTLPPNTVVRPGHGPSTSVGEEELNNPMIQ